MRTTKFLAAFAAVLALFSGCRQDEDYVLPSLEVGTETVEFTSGSQMTVELMATRDWMVKSVPEWAAVDPDHGSASSAPQRVNISVLPNESYDRTGTLLLTIGLKPDASVTLFQPGAKGPKSEGTGTLEDPFTVSGVLSYIGTLGADVESPQDVYIKGNISSVSEAYSAQYGNGSFVIKDPDGDQTFTVYRAKYLGNRGWKNGDTQIAEGDEVIVCGRVVNYRGNTPETAANKAFLYSLNGVSEGGSSGGGGGEGTPSGTGTASDPYNVAGARAAVANLTWTSNDDYQTTGDVYVKGKISKIADKGTFGESGTYGNASFYIKDDGADAEFYAFRILYLGNKKYESGTDIKVGDEVVICGKLMNYRGNTPETVAGKAFLYSLNGTSEGGSGGGGEGGGQGGGTGEVKTGSVADFIAAEPSETQKYQLTGKVSGTINTQYGNFDLVDDTGTVYVYGLTKTELGYGKKNDQSFASLGIKEGDTVTLIGYRGVYQDKIEVVYAYYVSHTSGSGGNGGGGNEGGGQQGNGSGTLNDPYNAAGAAAAVANLTWTSNTEYQTTDEVYVKGKICKIANKGTFGESGTYGNASFYISDDGKESGTQFYIFRTLYLGNKKYESGTDIKVGDEVVVKGKLMNYQGKTPETEGNKSYIYSLNGKTE